jgi:hypothetical protein
MYERYDTRLRAPPTRLIGLADSHQTCSSINRLLAAAPESAFSVVDTSTKLLAPADVIHVVRRPVGLEGGMGDTQAVGDLPLSCVCSALFGEARGVMTLAAEDCFNMCIVATST